MFQRNKSSVQQYPLLINTCTFLDIFYDDDKRIIKTKIVLLEESV